MEGSGFVALMGLDIGTTGSKCTIVDHDGKVLSYAYKEYKIISPQEGYFELDPNSVWNSVQQVIKAAVKSYSGEKILGLSVSSLGEAGVAVNEACEVLYNSLLYIDIRGREQVKELTEKLGEDVITLKTGIKPHAMYTLPKIMWMKENLPEIYEKIWRVMPFGEFILYRLGSRAVMDFSLASRTMAFNIKELCWDFDILKAAGVRKDLFSDVMEAGTMIGTIAKEIAADLGLPTDTKLVTGAHDQVCAVIGAGIIDGKKAMDGMGTVECIAPIFDEKVKLEEISKDNFPCVLFIRGKYTTYAFNFTGGSLLKWFRDNFGYEEMLAAEKLGKSAYEVFNENAYDKPTEILVLPHFAGTGTPYMDSYGKGAFIGIDFNTTKPVIYRALLEGITYEMKYNVECLEKAGIEIDELRACGGGARSDLWLQIKADIMNKKVIALDIDEAGTLGTIILTGIALGVYPSLEVAIEKLVKVKKEFYPNPINVEIYENNYKKYKKVYNAIKLILE